MKDKILCKLGFHWWGFQFRNGVYLHSLHNGSRVGFDKDYTNKRRCWDCNKITLWNNEYYKD